MEKIKINKKFKKENKILTETTVISIDEIILKDYKVRPM